MNKNIPEPERRWMIYGANGYTGELIAREAVKRGMRPVLAGRNHSKIDLLAREMGLDSVSFALSDVSHAASKIRGHFLVMHCAGPFSETAKPMMEACLQAGAHYLDITGEIAVFELGQSMTRRAREAGIVICPGVGFDVIPTDCIAATLKAAMPDATHLALGFDSRSTMSPGTSKTNLEGLALGGKVRVDGRIVSVPLGHRVRRIDFGNGEKQAMTIPWGDVATAFHTTGIPNVEVFIPATTGVILGARFVRFVRPLLALSSLQKLIQRHLGRTVTGPDASNRSKLPTYVWGEVRNAHGQIKTARLRTENVYSLTITGALAVTDHLMNNRPEGGAYTPAKLVGADLATRLPGSSSFHVS